MTAGTFVLRRAAVVYVALLCVVEVFALEDQATIRIPQSATTVTNFNCARPTPVTRLVRFQSFNVGGSQYERVSMSDQIFSFYFDQRATEKTFSAANLGMCVLAVGKAGMDAVQFINNTCKGYTLSASDMMCRCSSGTNVVFVKSSKIQWTFPKGGYKKIDGNLSLTLIYPSILLNSVGADDSAISGDCLPSKAQMASNIQYHDSAAGSCPGSFAIIDTSQCTSSCSMKPVLVISPLNPSPNKYFLDSCGSTFTIPLTTDESTPTVVQSHVGYGCSLYLHPTADTECAVTFVAVDDTVSVLLISAFLALSANGAACQDYISIYDGADTSGSLLKNATCTPGLGPSFSSNVAPSKLHVVFKRRAAVSGASPPIGFYLLVFGHFTASGRVNDWKNNNQLQEVPPTLLHFMKKL